MSRSHLAAFFLLFAVAPLPAQGTRADYDRADGLARLTRDKVFRASVSPNWFAGGSRFWYRNDLAGGAREFVLVDAVAGTRAEAFDHSRLAAALGADVKPTSLPIAALEFADDGKTVLLDVNGKGQRLDLATYQLTPGPLPRRPARADAPTKPRRFDGGGAGGRRGGDSPDGKWTAMVKDNNLHLKNKESGETFPLSKDGTADNPYDGSFWWSPDSSRLAALRTTKVEERKVYLIESSPRDQLQPKLHTLNYAKPGDTLPVSKPRLFDVASRAALPIKDDLFPNPWSVTRLRWADGGREFRFLYNQRGHQVMRLVGLDAATGTARAVIDETCKTFHDWNHKTFLQEFDATNEAIWMSERSGWNHLYLYDTRSGKVKNPITSGQWVVRGVDRVDAEKRQVWFRASAIRPGQDPYYIHYCRVNFDGSGLVVLTEDDGTHEIQHSPDGRFLIDTHSQVDRPPLTELRRTADGGIVCVLERADVSALEKAGWHPPERFVAKGRDGTTDIHGVLLRPTTFDPNKKYPVIENIYAGPQGSFVPKRFAPHYPMQSLAELGFIVVQIDGMGTSNRSKAFHDVCWKNLGDAGFPDRILWLKAAAAKYPQMDLTRVGIYGGSAGGQNALGGLLTHGDFYKVGVADCGCHDNRMDKVWWNEQWMGYPIGPHYAEQSNVTNAPKLKGKLLLLVGELDRNVDPASTMQVVNALIRANKDFDFVIFPGGGHGGGGTYAERRRRDFFVRHLLGVEPRRE